MSFIEVDKFIDRNKENKDNLGTKTSTLKLNCVHGADVLSIIKDIIDGFGNVLVIATGDEQKRRLDIAGIPYADLMKDFIRQKTYINGKIEFEYTGKLPEASCWVIWDVMNIPVELLDQVILTHVDPLVYIGDTNKVDLLGQGKMRVFMNDAILIDKVSKNTPGFSQELVYLANRFRNGCIDDISKVKNRSYVFTTEKTNLVEMLEYDIAVAPKNIVPDFVDIIRKDVFDYDILPVAGERMIAYMPCSVSTPTGEVVNFHLGDMFTVDEVFHDEGGLLTAMIEKDGRNISVPLDKNFIYGMLADERYSILHNEVGCLKAFYAYVVPAFLIMDKSFDSVYLQYYPHYGDNKEYLYSITSIARRNIVVQYEDDCKMLF